MVRIFGFRNILLADADPHNFGQLDTDTYQHQCEKLEPDP